jgi:hypothetical protein
MLEELSETMLTTRVVEARLRGDTPDEQLHGLCDYGRHAVYIDPVPSIIHTLLHELCHQRWPTWSERRVERESTRMFVSMDAKAIDRWYRSYLKARRKAKRSVSVED